MKCQNCGANLAIDDKVCPFCQSENPFAKQHRLDMFRFENDYSKTKEEALEQTKRFHQFLSRMIILLILILLIGIMFYMTYNDYYITKAYDNYLSNKHITEYKEQLDYYLEEKDYFSFGLFIEEHSLYRNSNYDDYDQLYNVANSYCFLYESLYDILIRDNTYNSIDYSIKNVHDSLTQIYDCIYRYSYYDEGCYEEDRQTHLVNMKEEAEMLLGHYAILSQEEIEELSNISEAKRFVLIEEALMKYEK